MSEKKKAAQKKVTQQDIEKTAHTAAELYSGDFPVTDLRELTATSNIHPTPTHEPTMPIEFFYNELSEGEDINMPDRPI